MGFNLIPAGLAAGSLYALMALSLNVMARPTNVFNLAQGDLAMLAAVFASFFLVASGLPWFVGAALVLLLLGIIAFVEELVAVAPVLRRSATATGWIVTTLAVSLIIENLVGKVLGPTPTAVPPPPGLSLVTGTVDGIRFSSFQVGLVVITLVVAVLIGLFYRTRSGKAILAVAEDRDAALLRGIDSRRLVRRSFFAGGVLAALAGLLAGPLLQASPVLAPLLLIRGFEAAAIGGVGSTRGGLAAGYLLGLSEAIGGGLVASGYQDAITFALMLTILVVRPRGLFGSRVARVV